MDYWGVETIFSTHTYIHTNTPTFIQINKFINVFLGLFASFFLFHSLRLLPPFDFGLAKATLIGAAGVNVRQL